MCEDDKEMEEWADLARKSVVRWCKENLYDSDYEDKTGNEPESFTIT